MKLQRRRRDLPGRHRPLDRVADRSRLVLAEG